MAMCASSILSLNMGMNLLFLLPASISLTSIISGIIGGSIGILFGLLVIFQSLLSIFFYGVVGGLMGTMLGAVIKNPSLCSLPTVNINMVEQNTIIFSLFGSILIVLTTGLLWYSLIKQEQMGESSAYVSL
ncbi:hypothetical protein [Lederbergia lenta]|nr:hypothetical protein [Lederbergia lenta]MEC2322890.1 hypothetical protein [Lederbergia lenta]